MNLIEINRKMVKVIQTCLNTLGGIKYWVYDRSQFRHYTRMNNNIKGIAGEETCFILGNGPSLNNVDLSLLQGKKIVTVNKSICTPVFLDTKPMFHVIIDRFILEEIGDYVEKELLREDSETIFILHRSGIKRFSKYKRARFVYATKMASSENAVRNDMTENMTTFLNVLPFASLCMSYVGFKNIVLLGNDFSFFASRKDQHFYDLKDNKKRSETLYSDLAGCSIVLLEYRNLYNYAKDKGIRLVNATEGSLLDEIPQVSLVELL